MGTTARADKPKKVRGFRVSRTYLKRPTLEDNGTFKDFGLFTIDHLQRGVSLATPFFVAPKMGN